jgi:hypothetical protein
MLRRLRSLPEGSTLQYEGVGFDGLYGCGSVVRFMEFEFLFGLWDLIDL